MKLNNTRLIELKNWYELSSYQTNKIKKYFQDKNITWYDVEEFMDSDNEMKNRFDPYSFYINKRDEALKNIKISKDQLYSLPALFDGYYENKKVNKNCKHSNLIKSLYDNLDDKNNISIIDLWTCLYNFWVDKYNAANIELSEKIDKYFSEKIKDLFNYDLSETKIYKNNKKENLGFVYLARQTNSENIYKIGKTKQLTIRESTFKTGNLYIQIIAYAESMYADRLEQFLHSLFRNKNIAREWFILDKSDIEILVNEFGFKFGVEFKNKKAE